MRTWPVWVAALWWGSLTTLGFAVVPLLFVYLPTPALAGATAARLFEFQTWASVLLGLLLLMASRALRWPVMSARAQAATGLIIGGMLLALLVQFGVAPRIVARENLQLWHALGSLMYFLQWFCAGATFWKFVKPDSLVS
jgi:hypothetical protein